MTTHDEMDRPGKTRGSWTQWRVRMIALLGVSLLLASGCDSGAQAPARDPGDSTNGEAPASAPAETSYSCAMHPNQSSDKPGDCSVCGMALSKGSKTDDSSGAVAMKTYRCT